MNRDRPPSAPQALSDRFGEAFTLAFELHRGQFRKHEPIPYLSHLLAVSSLVMEFGGDEQQAMAALLHDGPEDQGGDSTLQRIRGLLGDDVANLVADCSEPPKDRHDSWRARKEAHLQLMQSVPGRSALIIACDKLHNARSLKAALETEGEVVFERFNGSARGTRWWYDRVAQALHAKVPERLALELRAVADWIAGFPHRPFHTSGDTVRIQTSPARYWPHASISEAKSELPDWSGRHEVSVTGPGPAFMYAFLGARAAACGVGSLIIHRPGLVAVRFDASGETGVPDSPTADLEVSHAVHGLQVVRPASPGRIGDIPAAVAHAASRLRTDTPVVLTGSMPMAAYAGLAYAAVTRGCTQVSCVTPPDGMARVHVWGSGPDVGTVSELSAELQRCLQPADGPALTIGIIGFPNSGKSVLSRLLHDALQQRLASSWLFDADPASPTPAWQFSLLAATSDAEVRRQREAHKVEWTDALQDGVAGRLGQARPFFRVIIVDLPGGDMRHPHGPKPIPAGREPLFRQIDRFILVRRPDLDHDPRLWLDALKPLGLDGRLAAVLDSIDPDKLASIQLAGERPSESEPVMGTACGLNRSLFVDEPPPTASASLLRQQLLALAVACGLPILEEATGATHAAIRSGVSPWRSVSGGS